MILEFKQPRAYVCQFMNKGKEDSFFFYPGDNKIPDAKAKELLKHPGIKNRLDLGILVMKGIMTDNLAKEANEASKAKKAALAADDSNSKSSENHETKKAAKAKK